MLNRRNVLSGAAALFAGVAVAITPAPEAQADGIDPIQVNSIEQHMPASLEDADSLAQSYSIVVHYGAAMTEISAKSLERLLSDQYDSVLALSSGPDEGFNIYLNGGMINEKPFPPQAVGWVLAYLEQPQLAALDAD